MATKFSILGNENSVLYYNLNKQFCDISKVIVTKEILLASFETDTVRNLFEQLKETKDEEYLTLVQEAEKEELFDQMIKSELTNAINEKLQEISDVYIDVKLNNYSFMNSVSNNKLHLTLRCESFSLTRYNVEKSTLGSNIRKLLHLYLLNSANIFRKKFIDNIQLEVYTAIDIHKCVLLKKEQESLLLKAAFGYPYQEPFEHTVGDEFYFSKGEKFTFFKNNQTHANVREHSYITNREIHSAEKILSNPELIAINEKTKNISDALIELIITEKGGIKINHISPMLDQLYTNSENGILFHKGTNTYTKVALLSIRDKLTEETTNPKYLFVRNNEETEELLENLHLLQYVDGLIFTNNFYVPLLDIIGRAKNMDILYYKDALKRSLEVEIDWDKLIIHQKNEEAQANPFGAILQKEKESKDELLNKLKSFDLSTPPQAQRERANIEKLAEGLISSPQSSTASANKGNEALFSMASPKKGEKVSALGMLAAAALQRKPADEETPALQQKQEESQQKLQFSDFSETEKKEEFLQTAPKEEPFEEADPYDFFDVPKDNRTTLQSLSPPEDEDDESELYDEVETSEPAQKIDRFEGGALELQRYEHVLATELLTTLEYENKHYIVKEKEKLLAKKGKLYIICDEEPEENNPLHTYILPLHFAGNIPARKNHIFLLKDSEDFFHLDETEIDTNYMLNLNGIREESKEHFLRACIEKMGTLSLIASRSDLALVEKNINAITRLYLKDLETQEEIEEIKEDLLAFEKRFLMRE
ncbi:MAG: hypothetical protein H6500_04045 [Candidatus Woesearchaeota archaeon]|nr:MAG: hypothetical protein H6500_04045 [Candidatus Woesearchaeota archaeon]